jgi:hypothetical protein
MHTRLIYLDKKPNAWGEVEEFGAGAEMCKIRATNAGPINGAGLYLHLHGDYVRIEISQIF